MKIPKGLIITAIILVAFLVWDMGNLKNRLNATAADDEPDHVIIYQVYGRGDKIDAAISHSFIELYNPTKKDVRIDDWSLQYTAEGDNWKVFKLEGNIPAGSSFLIRCYSEDGIGSRLFITDFDLEWPERRISNNGFKLALVGHGRELPAACPVEGDGTVDFLGVGDTDYGDASPVRGISKQKTVRRISVTDTDDNIADFETIDYRSEKLAEDVFNLVRPRASAEGPWDPASAWRGGKLVFSAAAGLYAAPLPLILSTYFTDGVIHYTLDGTETNAESPVFADRIMLSDRTSEPARLANVTGITGEEDPPLPEGDVYKGINVRARVYTETGEPLSPEITKSYFVHPEIFSKYNGLPVISLVTNPENLFDKDTGIYMYDNYRETGIEWERPVHVEFFEGDGNLVISQNMGMRIHGLSSREYLQKSFRLYARSIYDAENPVIDYDLFEGRAVDSAGNQIESYRNFILRNCGNGWNQGFIKDSLIQRLCEQATDFNAATQAGRQCVAFINGEFWGIYNIRQRYDERYYADKYHLDRTKIQTAGKDSVDAGVMINAGGEAAESAYSEMMGYFLNTEKENFAEESVYKGAAEYIDIDNFIDVMIAYTYWGNRDWPINNYRMWRYAGPPEEGNPYSDGRWRLALLDFDLAWVIDPGNPILIYFLTNDGSAQNENTDAFAIYHALLENAEFRDRLVFRFCDLMDTAFSPSVVNPIIDEMQGNINSILSEQDARYPRASEIELGYLGSDGREMKKYVKERPGYMRDHLCDRLSLSDAAMLRLEKIEGAGETR